MWIQWANGNGTHGKRNVPGVPGEGSACSGHSSKTACEYHCITTTRCLKSKTRKGKYEDMEKNHGWKSHPLPCTYLQQCTRLHQLYREHGSRRGLHRWSESSQSPRRRPPEASGLPRNHGKLKTPGGKGEKKTTFRLWTPLRLYHAVSFFPLIVLISVTTQLGRILSHGS